MTPETVELLGDIRERLGRIETKLDGTEDHETRISKLESVHKLYATIGAMLLFVVTFFQERIAGIFA